MLKEYWTEEKKDQAAALGAGAILGGLAGVLATAIAVKDGVSSHETITCTPEDIAEMSTQVAATGLSGDVIITQDADGNCDFYTTADPA